MLMSDTGNEIKLYKTKFNDFVETMKSHDNTLIDYDRVHHTTDYMLYALQANHFFSHPHFEDNIESSLEGVFDVLDNIYKTARKEYIEHPKEDNDSYFNAYKEYYIEAISIVLDLLDEVYNIVSNDNDFLDTAKRMSATLSADNISDLNRKRNQLKIMFEKLDSQRRLAGYERSKIAKDLAVAHKTKTAANDFALELKDQSTRQDERERRLNIRETNIEKNEIAMRQKEATLLSDVNEIKEELLRRKAKMDEEDAIRRSEEGKYQTALSGLLVKETNILDILDGIREAL